MVSAGRPPVARAPGAAAAAPRRPGRGALILHVLLAAMVAVTVLHHGVAGPGHAGPAAHAHEACADCGHAGGVDALLMIACSALALASAIRPRLPRGGVTRTAVPRAGAAAAGVRSSGHLRAPPAPPDLHRLCVLLR